MTDADKITCPRFVTDPTDIRIGINPKILIRIPDHFWLKFWRWWRFALSECCSFDCACSTTAVADPAGHCSAALLESRHFPNSTFSSNLIFIYPETVRVHIDNTVTKLWRGQQGGEPHLLLPLSKNSLFYTLKDINICFRKKNSLLKRDFLNFVIMYCTIRTRKKCYAKSMYEIFVIISCIQTDSRTTRWS